MIAWGGLLVALVLAASPRFVEAQPGPDSTVSLAPGERYRASGFHRFFLGDTYRSLWATSIRIPVLDLARYAGGLEAIERGGSKQSRSLRFRSGDGRTFAFRALDKDPTQMWPGPLRNSPARKFAEDQISAILPTGALAVAVLEEAAGILHSGIRLVVLPDDARLGQWRDEFANLPGIIEQRLRGSGDDLVALPGAREVVTSEELFRRLESDNRQTVDQVRFAAARLFDLVVGDWDRHAGQWSWARFDDGEGSRWVPVPRDRDWAMSRLDGPLYGLLRLYLPKYQSFGRGYGSIYGLTFSAEGLDRRLLVGLSAATWDSVARDLQGRLGDAVIDRAVQALPAEFPATDRAVLRRALMNRRDELPRAAARFYRQLAGQVELRGSNAADSVLLEVSGDGVEVSFSGRPGPTRWRRRFDPKDTDELRLMFYDGADRLVVRGTGPSPIRIRVVDDSGRLEVDSAAAGSVERFTGLGRYRPPVPRNDPLLIHRDWGHLYGVAPWFEARPEIGVLVGGGPVITSYGFRKAPYASRFAIRTAMATGAGGLNLDVDGDIRFARHDRRLALRASMLRTDVVRYFGFGNETVRATDLDVHTTRQRLIAISPTLVLDLSGQARVDLSAFFRASNTDLSRATLLATDRPYGSGDFSEAGLEAAVRVDSRDHPRYPTSGFQGEVVARLVPALFDATGSFGGLEAKAAYFVTAPLPARPTLALRAGASRDWGRVPFFEAPSIGGRGSVRGLNSHRFLGDAAVFGGGELRLDLGHFTAIVPGDWGVYGLADAGRVYLDGQSSDRWHTAVGGGLWFALLDRRSTMTVTYASSAERARWYIQAGFHF